MGGVFGLFGGLYYWSGKLMGERFKEEVGRIELWRLLIGVNVSLLGEDLLGLEGMGGRIVDYGDGFG
ncbi:hypothetical protein E3Q02_04457, partial [Wallemia mellicola]